MISRIHKSGSPTRLISYLLQSTKAAQIVDTSLFTPEINKLIAYATVIDDSSAAIASVQLNEAFSSLNSLNPRLQKNTMHLIVGFDPSDGELTPEFKGQIARDIINAIGYHDTYWVAISHGRDDPEHDHIHDHDHMHILSARVNTNGKTISDSWDFSKASKVLREIEQRYELTPFVAFWEREYATPEINWVIHPEQELIHQESQTQSRTH